MEVRFFEDEKVNDNGSRETRVLVGKRLPNGDEAVSVATDDDMAVYGQAYQLFRNPPPDPVAAEAHAEVVAELEAEREDHADTRRQLDEARAELARREKPAAVEIVEPVPDA